MISVLILTRNEERNLPDCLATLRWSDDIHVLDSLSDDGTTEIARQFGAKVWQRGFVNFSDQQNWALGNIDFKYPWIFHLDADERVTPRLAQAMQAAVTTPGSAVAFEIQRRDFFLGAWLKHTQVTAWYPRLFRREKMRYERAVHQVSIIDGPAAKVAGYLDHFPFSKGIADWIAKHNRYSTFEATILSAMRDEPERVSFRKALFSPSLAERRRNQKQIYYRLPFRPLVKFLAMYILKRGFLDGRAGFAYSALIGFYEYMIVLKVRELESSTKPQVR